MAKILIADDEKEIVQLLKLYLENEKTIIYEAENGSKVLEILEKSSIDLAILDIMMPKVDGYQIIRKIREKDEQMPILVISAKVSLPDRIFGIDLGADDYITKPFEPLEVAAKVRAHLRRNKTGSVLDYPVQPLQCGSFTLDRHECVLIKDKRRMELTKTEFKVLELLMSQPGRVFTKEQIYEYAWKENGLVDDNSLRVIISRLRYKMGPDAIHTIRGLGYRMEKP